MASISCEELLQRQRNDEFTLLDVRLHEIKESSPLSIAGALWRNPEHIEQWVTNLPTKSPVIVFCAHGRSISQGIAKKLNEHGLKASYLEGGLAAWIEKGYVVVSLQHV